MFLEQLGQAGSPPAWGWGETDCQQEKFFLCEYPAGNLSHIHSAWANSEVACPWNLTVSRSAEVTMPSLVPVLLPESDGFPLAALIAGLVAGVVLLVCSGLTAVVCARRKRVFGKQKTQATAHALYIDSDGRRSHSLEKVHRGKGKTSASDMEKRHRDVTSLDDENFYLSGTSIPARMRDYMTLQAQMDVKDDLDLSSCQSGQDKPEVALVTDDMDMSFTVNHAVSHPVSRAGSEKSRSSVDRGMEEIAFSLQAENGVHFKDYSL